MASLLVNGEAQDAIVPDEGYEETRAVSLDERRQFKLARMHVVVGDRTAGRFSDGKQGSLAWPEAVFMLLSSQRAVPSQMTERS
jgi:hypothetical protein